MRLKISCVLSSVLWLIFWTAIGRCSCVSLTLFLSKLIIHNFKKFIVFEWT